MNERERMMRRIRILRETRVLGATLALVVPFAACNFDVTNPGPVQDEFLNDSDAFEAVVNGMGRDLSDGLNYLAFHGSMVVRELFPTGGTGQFGISPRNADGFLDANDQGTPWNLTQRARWVAEDGLRRFAENMEASEFSRSEMVAQAHLWAGYSNRALGENMCQAVIDGGAPLPRSTFLERAEQHFSDAIDVASAAGSSTIATAARAARASVRVQLGDWPGAVSDAGGIATSFVYEMPYFDRGDQSEYNRIAHASANDPYKTHTVWGTIYADYYLASGDPRVAWVDTGLPGDGGVACCGQVPFYQQIKFPDKDAPITLSSGAEMRLIEAENALIGGSWESALSIINDLRAVYGVDPWTASGSAEAWARLKRERGIQLWLEGRRLGDFYRWNQEGTPGALDPLEILSPESYLLNQDLCFPIPDGERDTNPNVS